MRLQPFDRRWLHRLVRSFAARESLAANCCGDEQSRRCTGIAFLISGSKGIARRISGDRATAVSVGCLARVSCNRQRIRQGLLLRRL